MSASAAVLTSVAHEALELSLATSAACLVVLLVRQPVRTVFGARVAYALWWLLPAAIVAVLLPAPSIAPAAIELGRASAGAGSPMALSAETTATTFDLARLWPVLATLWLAGCGIALLRMAEQQRRFRRALGKLEPLQDALWRASARDGLPAVVGLRARIVLPADFEYRYAPQQQALVLAHERVHVRRGDLYCNFGFALLCALQWFNPLLRLAQRAYRLDQELACDACVLAMHPQSRRSYGEALLRSSSTFPAAPLGCPAFGTHPLKERITMLTRPLPSLNRRLSGLALSIALGLGFAGIAWSQQAPRPADAELLDIQLELSIEGGPVQTPRVITPTGQDFGVRLQAPDGQSWSFDLVAERVQQDQFEVSGQIRREGELTDQPSLRLREGVPGRMTLDKPDGSSVYALGLTVQSGAEIAPPPPPPAPAAPPAPPAPPAAPALGAPPPPPNVAQLPDPPAPPAPPKAPTTRPSTATPTRAVPAVAPAAPSAPAAAPAASPSYRSLSAPEYPAEAKAAGIKGTTLLRLGIDASGRVRTIDIDVSSGHNALDGAASDAVERWTFNPATSDGRAIDSQIQVPVQFIAANSDAAPFVAPPGALDTIVLRAD
jgi:bla regulator protein blaR1